MEESQKAKAKAGLELRPGQLWKTDEGCILITDQGERLIGYRKLRSPDQRSAITNLIRPEALACYLDRVGGVLQSISD